MFSGWGPWLRMEPWEKRASWLGGCDHHGSRRNWSPSAALLVAVASRRGCTADKTREMAGGIKGQGGKEEGEGRGKGGVGDVSPALSALTGNKCFVACFPLPLIRMSLICSLFSPPLLPPFFPRLSLSPLCACR